MVKYSVYNKQQIYLKINNITIIKMPWLGLQYDLKLLFIKLLV